MVEEHRELVRNNILTIISSPTPHNEVHLIMVVFFHPWVIHLKNPIILADLIMLRVLGSLINDSSFVIGLPFVNSVLLRAVSVVGFFVCLLTVVYLSVLRS